MSRVGSKTGAGQPWLHAGWTVEVATSSRRLCARRTEPAFCSQRETGLCSLMPGLPWIMSGKCEGVGSGGLNLGGEEEGLSGGLVSGILLDLCGDFYRKACRDPGDEDMDGSELVHADEGLSELRIFSDGRGRRSKSKGEKEVRTSRPKRTGRDLRTSAGQVSCLRLERYYYAHFIDVSSEAQQD